MDSPKIGSVWNVLDQNLSFPFLAGLVQKTKYLNSKIVSVLTGSWMKEIKERKKERKKEWMNERKKEWMNEWMKERKKERKNELINELMN